MKASVLPKCVASLLLLGTLSGCSWLSYSMPAAQSAAIATDKVIVVGRFELDPPLNPEYEQKTHWNVVGDDAITNRLFMLTAPHAKPLDTDTPSLSDFRNNIGALWDTTFFMTGPRERTHFRGGMVVLDAMSGNDRIWFPGGYYYDVPANASAVYIGTLRYTRGDFYKIKRVEVRDDYATASAQFRQQFGASATLKKSLLKRAL